MLTLLSTFYLTIGYTIFNYIPWTIFFVLLRPFGVRFYKLVKAEECKVIQKKITENSSHLTDNNKAFGYSFGYWYIIHLDVQVSDYGDRYEIHLVCLESSYLELITDSSSKEIIESETCVVQPKIDIIERYGSYSNLWYKIRPIVIPLIIERPHQKVILDKIIEHHDIHKQTSVFLHGNPGVGKSMIGILLAKHYNGIYCDSFIPWEPNSRMGCIYIEASPSKKKPLIIVLEEIDVVLHKIHNGIELHKNYPILITNKSSWNKFFDGVQIGLYPNIILVLTSNKKPEVIDALDTAYLRENRINLLLELV